jgi:hypothetical protein
VFGVIHFKREKWLFFVKRDCLLQYIPFPAGALVSLPAGLGLDETKTLSHGRPALLQLDDLKVEAGRVRDFA